MREGYKPLSRRWRIAVFLLTAVAVVVGDQLSKGWVRANIALGERSPEDAFIFFTHVRNTGASFGTFQGHSFELAVIGIVGVGVVLFYALYITRRFPYLNNLFNRAALGMILGGAVGNLIDRFKLGYVTDFVGVGTWPPYNVADASIVAGVATFVGSLLYLVFGRREQTSKSLRPKRG